MFKDRLTEREVITDAVCRKSALRPRRFLKGPIAMGDIATASRLGGKALVVYLATIHRRDLTRQDEFTLPKSLLEELGVGRDTKSNALRELEAAGLLTVTRTKGNAARIRIAQIGGFDEPR